MMKVLEKNMSHLREVIKSGGRLQIREIIK